MTNKIIITIEQDRERFDKNFRHSTYCTDAKPKDEPCFCGIDEMKGFISLSIEHVLESLKEEVGALKKSNKGIDEFANFKGKSDEIWIYAKPVKPNIKKLVYNSALSSVSTLIDEVIKHVKK